VFALAVEFVIHMPMDFLVLLGAVEDPVTKTAALVGILLADCASLHISLLVI